MSEHPILFSALMVRAILEGRKADANPRMWVVELKRIEAAA